jgi:hypothetical protein
MTPAHDHERQGTNHHQEDQMRRHLLPLALVAFAVLAAGASSTLAAGNGAGQLFIFNGHLEADAGTSSTIYVDIAGGNHAALRKLVGQSSSQSFTVGPGTQFLRWTHGVPTVVPESNLVAGDRVSVRVRDAHSASLAQIEATQAGRVADSGPNPRFANKPLWLFVGKLDAPASGGHLTLHIVNGNLRALRAMLGQPLDQTFSYDAHTIFVLWHGRVPTLISPSSLVVGDRISVRIRARAVSSLSQVESTPANHVGDHEPGM